MGCTSEEGGNQSRRFHITKITVTNLRDEALKALCEFNTAPSSKTDWYVKFLFLFYALKGEEGTEKISYPRLNGILF